MYLYLCSAALAQSPASVSPPRNQAVAFDNLLRAFAGLTFQTLKSLEI